MEYQKSDEDLDLQQEQDYTELTSIIKTEMDDAQDFSEELGQERSENTDYYLGEEPNDTSELQSEYVSTDVREAVLHILPSIMRVFFGTKKVVDFIPRDKEDVALAEQQTNYINYIINQKNNGFQVFYNAFKDALIRKAGFIKAYYDDGLQVTNHTYTGLTEIQKDALILDPNVEVVSQEAEMEMVETVNELGETIVQETPVSFDLKIRRITNKSKVCIDAIPPEEVLISRDARTIETAEYVAHRKICPVSDLVAMGYDREEMLEHAGAGKYDNETYNETVARNPFAEPDSTDRPDDDMQNVLYVEHYVLYDLDDDGIAERIKVCTIGNGCEIINVEPCDVLPIAMFQSDPEPHTVVGQCMADYLKGIQSAKSQIMRDTLDSLGHSIFPRMVITEGQVNIDDVLNTDIGQPIRVRTPGAVQPLSVPFVGKDAFPVLNYLDSVKEDRTGTSKASAGLNADALQSSTKTAVAATMSASQGRTELICRHFAETGMKPLFKIIYNLVVRHQNQEEMFRLNNDFIPVDPRYWDADKDVEISVAISKTSDEEKGQFLTQLVQIQKEAFQQMGGNNPLVTPQQFSNTLAKLIELAGFKDIDEFINTEVVMPPQDPSQEKPSGEELLAMAESEKAKAQANKAILDAENDRLKMMMDDDFKRDQANTDALLKVMELNAKYGTELQMNEVNAYLERDKEEIRQRNKNGSIDGTVPGTTEI
tara:strand:- start:1031 stop:3160 length:2130 start_codon:yes stop_codon:yes gene_type:complete